uniref:Metallophos domain-containing protein n=1 Tax=Heterorhabditis bacteriophora TaxID=37862 RepID=A0A1I7X837_HETBA
MFYYNQTFHSTMIFETILYCFKCICCYNFHSNIRICFYLIVKYVMIFRVLLISAGFVFVYSLTVLHLSDFHLDVNYSIYGDNQKMCHKMNGTAEALLGSFGDYMCDSPKDLVSFTLDQAKRLFPNPDVVLWTGDNVPHIDSYDWNCELFFELSPIFSCY